MRYAKVNPGGKTHLVLRHNAKAVCGNEPTIEVHTPYVTCEWCLDVLADLRASGVLEQRR